MPRIRALSPSLLRILADFSEVTGPDEFARLCRSVATLSHLFTRDRGASDAGYMADDALRRGYVAYFLPVNLGKVQALLDELPASDQAPTSPLRVLDIGSGPGTAALAVLDWMRHQPGDRQGAVEAVVLDRSAPALRDAERLWTAYMREARVPSAMLAPLRADIGKGRWLDELRARRPAGFDLVIAANVLSEVGDGARDAIERRTALAESLLSLLAPQGSLIVIEPALRETSRCLHHVRDALLAKQVCTVYSPCLHDRPCPALVKADDWCHEERGWTPPPIVSAIDQVVGFIKDALKFSYVILRKDGRTIVHREPTVYRVVSELREMKGEKRAWLCNESGRPEVGRLDRMRLPVNAAFDEWHRGAIVRVDQIERRDRKGRESTIGRIPTDARVEILRSV